MIYFRDRLQSLTVSATDLKASSRTVDAQNTESRWFDAESNESVQILMAQVSHLEMKTYNSQAPSQNRVHFQESGLQTDGYWNGEIVKGKEESGWNFLKLNIE